MVIRLLFSSIFLMRLISTQRVREQEDSFPILYATPEPLSSPEFPVHNTLFEEEGKIFMNSRTL